MSTANPNPYVSYKSGGSVSKRGDVMLGALSPCVVGLTDTSTVSVDASKGNEFRLLLTPSIGSTRVIGAPTNPTDGQAILISLQQPVSGGPCSVTWASAFDFGSSSAPTLSSGANAVDDVAWRYHAGLGKWRYHGTSGQF